MNEESPVYPLILASGSASRRVLLERLQLPFSVKPADIDERAWSQESPDALVERLSRGKARAVSRVSPGAVVIGSDQVAVFAGEATSKPGTLVRAAADLRRFSGHTVTFLTGVCVRQQETGHERYFMDRTEVLFRELSDEEINRYLAADDPLACAGGFKVESLGPSLFRAVRSTDPTALPGLPLIQLCAELRELGFPLP